MNEGSLFSRRMFCNDFILKTMHRLKYNATRILFHKNGDRCLDTDLRMFVTVEICIHLEYSLLFRELQ